jgi:MFS family permease
MASNDRSGKTKEEDEMHEMVTAQSPDAAAVDGGDDGPPLPPDGGWGWAVVVASFLTNFIVDGVCYTFGVIQPELVDYFETTNSMAALVGSTVPGVYLIVGPIVSALANKFGCKIVAIVGSIIAGVFFAISILSPSIEIMILTYGVMGGVGFGLMYLPSIVMVGYYFDKKRALATGIAVCGSGMGTFVMAPLASWLVTELSWKGANLIIGAIIFNGIAFGMIYRPLEQQKRPAMSPGNGSAPASAGGQGPKSAIFRSIVEQKQRQRTISTGSLDGTVITKDNRLVAAAAAEPGLTNGTEDAAVVGSSLHVIPEVTVDGPTDAGATAEQPVNKSVERVRTRTRTTSQSSHGSQLEDERREEKKRKEQLASPFVRQDIFYAGSVTKLDEYKASPDMATYVQSHMSIPGIGDDGSSSSGSLSPCKSCGSVLRQMFDVSLLRSPTFIIITLSGVLTFLGLYTPFVYVYQKALKELEVEASKASIILSILGVFNTLGRLVAGWLADRSWADSLIIHNVSAILAGVLTCLVAVIFSYELLCVYAALFGTFIAAFIALRSIVIVDLLGIQKLTNAFGLMALFQGFACLFGSPISGALLEASGSYVVPFVVSGMLIGGGGAVCLPARRIAEWEKSRQKKRPYQPVASNVAA